MAFVTFKRSEANNKNILRGVFPVVQKVDNAIRRISLYALDNAIAFLKLINLILISSVDSAIHLLNNRGQHSIYSSRRVPT